MAKRFKFPRISPRAIGNALFGRAARKFVGSLLVRFYALIILALVLAAGYLSVHYLIVTVFLPPKVPAEILTWQAKLDIASLRGNEAKGVSQAPRPPINHYHGVEQWFQSDRYNGCTTSGCHEPLPHDSRAKVPAFANFHATFLTCQMCHTASDQQPRAASWVNADTGAIQQPPPILKLVSYLETRNDEVENNSEVAKSTINTLLSQTLADIGQDQILDQLLAEMESTQAGSPVWKHAVLNLTAELPQHTRGEYRAKLAVAGDAGSRIEQCNELARQAKQFLAMPSDSAPRKALQTTLHSSLAAQPAACVACHEQQPGLLDFASAGYSPNRSKFLGHLEVAILMQKIRQGEHFYLPQLKPEGQ